MKQGSVAAFTLISSSFLSALSLANDDIQIDQSILEFTAGYDKRLRYTPSTVEIIDAQSIEKTGALTVAELLERVVGIHVSRRPHGSNTVASVRGIDSKLLILHNGIEINKFLPELLAMPVVDLERLEIVKGSHYPLYGASAVVGTVNLVTKSIEDNESVFGIRAGTLDTSQIWTRRSQTFDNGIGYSTYLSYTGSNSSEGTITTDVQTIIDSQAGTNLSAAPGQGSFGVDAVDARLSLEFGRWTFHQYLNARELGAGIGFGQALDPDGTENAISYSADLRYARPLANGVFESRVTYNMLQLSYEGLQILPAGSFGIFPEGVIQRKYEKDGADVYAEALIRTRLGERHDLEFGIGASSGYIDNGDDIRNFQFQEGSPSTVPLGGFFELSDTSPLFGGDQNMKTAYAMARDRFDLLPDLSLVFGGRIDYSSDIGTNFIPRIGLDWAPGPFTNATLLYGEGVRAPTEVARSSQGSFFALGDDTLKPLRIRVLELAMDHQIDREQSVRVNIYGYELKDAISIIRDPSAPNGLRYANLSDNERGTGIELAYEIKPTDNALIRAGINIVDVQSGDIDVAVSPRADPYLEFDIEKGRWAFNAALITVMNRNRRDSDPRPPIDDYTLLSARLGYQSVAGVDGLNASLAAQNLLDEDAREDISQVIVDDLPVYPRRILAGLQWQF